MADDCAFDVNGALIAHKYLDKISKVHCFAQPKVRCANAVHQDPFSIIRTSIEVIFFTLYIPLLAFRQRPV